MSAVKLVHVSCALLTFVLFSLRGILMLQESAIRRHPLLRISPHIIDTCLLLSGLGMAISYYSAFYMQDWLMAKLTALIVYIIAGSIALKYGRTKVIRVTALVFAWFIFLYIQWPPSLLLSF